MVGAEMAFELLLTDQGMASELAWELHLRQHPLSMKTVGVLCAVVVPAICPLDTK